MNITLLETNAIGYSGQQCIDWCKNQIAQIEYHDEYSGYSLIIISIILLTIYSLPIESKVLEVYGDALFHLAIYLQVGFLIMRLFM